MIAPASIGWAPPGRHPLHPVMLIAIAMASILLLCGFQPVAPEVTYTRLPFDKVIGVYRDAYAHTGMTVMTVATESRRRNADGSIDIIGTYGFAYPTSARKRGKTGGIVFTVRALRKRGICIECSFSCRYYSADLAADGKATAEIRHRLGQSLPAVTDGSPPPSGHEVPEPPHTPP